MRFEPSEQALALRDSVQAALRAVTPDLVRAGWPGGDADAVRACWRTVLAGGVAGALVAEADGGFGLGEADVVPALEALGYSGLPLPVVETVVVAAPLLAAATPAVRDDVLSGAAIVAMPPLPGDDRQLLPWGQICDLVLLVQDGEVRLSRAEDVTQEAMGSVDGGRRLTRIVRVDRSIPVPADDEAIARATLRATLGTAALLSGLSRRMLDMTVGYVKQREQFGVPIGSFQAIKHQLASALLAVSFAAPAVHAAGWSLAHGTKDAGVRVSLAKVLTSEAALRVARTAIQCHGAIAYTTEYDLHLFAKRVWALAPAWGDAAWHRHRIAEHLGLAGADTGRAEESMQGEGVGHGR